MFKHAIIKNYMPPFLAMTGSTSDGRRVVVMDGFAGRGRYADRTPGSAELILQAIQKLRDSRTVAAFFAEINSENYQALESVIGEYARKGLRAWARMVRQKTTWLVSSRLHKVCPCFFSSTRAAPCCHLCSLPVC